MHIGILQCGFLPESSCAQYGDMPDMFIAAFNQVDPTLTFTIYDVINDPLPSLNACDAFLCTGSTNSSYDNTPWIQSLESFIREGFSQQKKMLGVCFGHQIITQALGGIVEPCERGWSLGTAFNELNTRKAWMTPALDKLDILAMHRDQVTALPENSELIAHSQFCPYFMVQHGDSILTIQGHPEFTPEIVCNLTEAEIDNFPANKIREAKVSMTASSDASTLIQWMINFIRG